jgi:hypothetical protein
VNCSVDLEFPKFVRVVTACNAIALSRYERIVMNCSVDLEFPRFVQVVTACNAIALSRYKRILVNCSVDFDFPKFVRGCYCLQCNCFKPTGPFSQYVNLKLACIFSDNRVGNGFSLN